MTAPTSVYAPPQLGASSPSPGVGHRLSAFRTALRAACGRRVQAVPATASGSAELRREAGELDVLRDSLAHLHARVPAREGALLHTYRSRLAAQIRLDRRIARAIDDRDIASERVGTIQNEANLTGRTQLAGDLGVACLAPAKA